MRIFLACIVGLLSSAAVMAQGEAPSPAAAPPPPTPENVTKSNGAGLGYLTRRYKISSAEAAERLEFQNEVSTLALKLGEENPQEFGGIFIEHQPVYRIVILFKDAENRDALRSSIAPQMRRFVQIQKAKFSQLEWRGKVDALSKVLAAGGVRAVVGFDPRSEKLNVTVADDRARAKAGTLIPAGLAPDALVKVGLLPSDAQTGYVSGDYTYGGWTLYDSANNPRSTSGFVVRMSDSRYGITVSGHSTVANPRLWVNGHYVTLPAAVALNANNNSAQYDFKVHPTGSLSISGYVAYTNNQPIRGYESIVNSVPGYANSGYFGIKDGLYLVGNNYGDVRCKQGQRTGLSCGEVVDTYATYTTEDGVTRTGMVALGYSDQRVIGFSGDSGGPVFTPPASDGTVMPAGLVSSVNGPTSGGPCDNNVYSGCLLYYMPIDRINDYQPMQIKTMTGTLNP